MSVVDIYNLHKTQLWISRGRNDMCNKSINQIHIEICEIKTERLQGVEFQRGMAHLLQSLQDYFTLDEINIDNWTFKLFYKVRLNTLCIKLIYYDCYQDKQGYEEVGTRGLKN